MGVLTRHKEPAGQSGVTPGPAAQSKPGRFANLRAKLSKPNEHAEVQHVGMFAAFESTLLQHGFLHESPITAASYPVQACTVFC